MFNFQVESISNFNDTVEIFPSGYCEYDYLQIGPTIYCGGFSDAFDPSDATFAAALDLPHTITVDISTDTSVSFSFITDGTVEFYGFVFFWVLI